MTKFRHVVSSLLIATAFASIAFAQPATPEQRAGVEPNPGFGTMHLQTNLGSFKLVDGKGRAEFTFTGTVLLSQVKGQASVTGDVRKEYDARGRQVYSGTGKVVVVGSWRGIQWFGRNMKGFWYGAGVARVGGEFDRNLKTGELWYDDPKTVMAWPAQGTGDFILPQSGAASHKPKVRVKGA